MKIPEEFSNYIDEDLLKIKWENEGEKVKYLTI
jgi:hypothetical protein